MKNWKRHMSFLLAAVTASAVMSFPALAKTKYVTSISLKVHTDLETGDSIDDGESISTENGSGEGTYVYSSSSRYRVVEADWRLLTATVIRSTSSAAATVPAALVSAAESMLVLQGREGI